MYTYGWFMLRFDKKQNSVKQLSFSQKINLLKIFFKKRKTDLFLNIWHIWICAKIIYFLEKTQPNHKFLTIMETSNIYKLKYACIQPLSRVKVISFIPLFHRFPYPHSNLWIILKQISNTVSYICKEFSEYF